MSNYSSLEKGTIHLSSKCFQQSLLFIQLKDVGRLYAYVGNTSYMFRGKDYRLSRYLGLKHNELTDHLGNVNVAVLDKISGTGTGNAGEYAYLSANISSFNDYYPFGMPMPERNGSLEKYRFGFNGQEKDNEIKGDGNSLNYTYRMHDPRIGRFFAVDPIAGKFPWNSPYVFAENQVIAFVELEGLEKATPKQKQNALDAVNMFANNDQTTTVWKKISKRDFVSSLTNMLNNSSSIAQENTNLCGIAVSCKASIEYNPEEFVAMALSIYQIGKYGDYEANSDLYNKSSSKGLNSAAFVIMTTLRNSLNVFLDYDPSNDNGTSGFTYPGDVSNILNKAMGMKITTKSNWGSTSLSGKDFQNGITKAINAGHIVILTINTEHFMGSSTWSVSPDHFIQVTGITDNIDGTINVYWWSWGKDVEPIKMTREQLINSTYFYGSFE